MEVDTIQHRIGKGIQFSYHGASAQWDGHCYSGGKDLDGDFLHVSYSYHR